jgi:transcriptional regulator with XRE-family HTH domain
MDRLAELREQRALTLRELSKTSGVSPDTINQIELGHRKARPSTLRKLARALEVDIKDFFEDEELATRPKGRAPLPPDDAVQAAGPQSLEWAIAAPAEEYSEWILNAAPHELHKTWILLSEYAKDLETGRHHRLVTDRAQAATARFFRLNPPVAVRPRKSKVSAEDENQKSREAG